ncbi:uncharacterized protein LOC126749647 [Anthonomus grandis grandis]|uniref:uncharacterized protein LOC126749647 n=1 Tax=Anthonomus grandis grandis TaxID=2921223 RepID=UPI0021658D85|nr:uncharacterized protein LOC126749647 [Anthonomus grandis grandis]
MVLRAGLPARNRRRLSPSPGNPSGHFHQSKRRTTVKGEKQKHYLTSSVSSSPKRELIETSVDDDIHEKERTEFENNYFSVVSRCQTYLENHEQFQTSSAMSSHIENKVTLNSGLKSPQVKLPTITLPSFDGNFEQWLFFKDTFQSLIHTDNTIPDINKFHYLRLSLKGQALDLLTSLEISSNNYAVAWNLLVERYENKPLLIKNHIKALFEIKSALKEGHKELRTILDGMNRHLRALEVLGLPVDSWDVIITYLFSLKLDPVTRREWESEYAKHDIVTKQMFANFLAEKCRILETINSIPQPLCNANQHNTSKANKQHIKTLFSTHVPICSFCNKNHTIYNCKNFIDLNPYLRLQEAKKHKLCINCLRDNHKTEQCRSSPCRKCQVKHNTLLHFSFNHNDTNQNRMPANSNAPLNCNVATSSEIPKISENNQTCLFSGNCMSNRVLLSTALVDIADNQGRIHSCRILLDSGSESSFISESFCKKLNLKTQPINCTVTGINQKATNILKHTKVKLQARQVPFNIGIKCLVLPKIANQIPSFLLDVSHIKIPPNLILADPSYNVPGSIDILIGADYFWDLLMLGQIKLGKHMPTLQKTQFGWIVSGMSLPPYVDNESNSVMCNLSTLQHLENQVSRFWEIEEVQNVKNLSPDETFCEQLFQETTQQTLDGRFIVQLPLKRPASSLGDSREAAIKLLLNLEQRLNKNPDLKRQYFDFLNEYISLGHMTQIDVSSLSHQTCYYLPHHCVIKDSSTTTKLRVVFNASSLTTSGLSLNDILRVGPTVQQDLFSIVLRARKHNIMITADIAKMYRQVLVSENQRSMQLILWRSDTNTDIQTFQLKTLTYGTAPAAFLSTRCLKEISIRCKQSDPNISQIIENDFYIDDLCSGCTSKEEAFFIINRISDILASFGFPLRKFMSNNADIISSLDSTQTKDTIFRFGEPNENKTLGLLWNSESDFLQYFIKTFDQSNPTKRKILSCVSQIFDPLGLLQPVIIIAKTIIQKLWQCKISWDESIPLDLHTTWLKFQNNLQEINNIRIPRHVLPEKFIKVQLHGFSDASQMAYGACIYIVSTDINNKIHSHLLCSKTRVAPLKVVTIPRLELCAALLLSELMHKVKNALALNIDQCFYWSDSTIALSWIRSNPQHWKIFVANRVNQIQSLTDSNLWNYVNTHENPADLLSRGLDPKNLISNTLWWHGPHWLVSSEEEWPTKSLEISNIIDDSERRIEKPISFMATASSFDLLERFSTLTKLQRVTAYCYRFFKNCREPCKGKCKIGHLEIVELKLALSPQLLLASVRDRFWPTSGRNLAKQVVKQCARCFRFNATSASHIMGNLPDFRVTQNRPFYNVGVDYCGPFLIKDRSTRNYKTSKAWLCLFVCLSVKAIHLELVSSLSTEAFIATLRRFFSRRGISANIYSDHGSNFVGAKNEISKFLFKNQNALKSEFSQENIQFHFIPPHSPHFGGIWEAGVKSSKYHIKRVLNQTPLTFEEFSTVLTQIEACLNSRPLYPYSEDPNDPQPITPGHFLIGQRLTALPSHDYLDIKDNGLTKLQRLQKIVQGFWKRWSKEFISELQQRSKWKTNCKDLLKPGVVVLIKEDGVPPLKWKLGLVQAVHPGSDGVVRTATIKTASTVIKRPAVKLCVLPRCE